MTAVRASLDMQGSSGFKPSMPRVLVMMLILACEANATGCAPAMQRPARLLGRIPKTQRPART